jgi:hypothetical protein
MRLASLSRLAATAAILLGAVPAWAATAPGARAVWASRQISFVYQGFTTRYSCDGLREDIRDMLAKLGARDLEVRAYGCTRLVGVEPFPGVRVTMKVLVPAPAHADKKAGALLAAHWQEVVLMPDEAGLQDEGNCELIEQFKQTFLPLFTTRHIRYQSNCIPHQLTLGTHLSAEVLMPDAKPARAH